jgi:hypothetical protein
VTTVRDNWGWAAAGLGLWLGRGAWGFSRPDRERAPAAHRAFAIHGLAAVAFLLLYVLMLRFSIYFYAFATVALFHAMRRFPSAAAPRAPRRWAAVAALALAVVSLQAPARMLWGMATATGGELSREADWAAAGRALPVGARVAADWGLTPNVLYYAPHARFLNVLNSVFMAVPHPDEYRAWRQVLAGESEDPVTTLREQLDSDHLVLSRFFTEPRLLAALRNHPRAELVYAGYTLVFRLHGPPADHEPTPP